MHMLGIYTTDIVLTKRVRFLLYIPKVQLLEFESRRIKKVKRHFREIRSGKAFFPGSKVLLTSNRLLLKGQQNQRATRPKIKEEK